MLALAHPVQHTSVDCSHRSTPSSTTTRPVRPGPRRPSSFTVTTSSNTPSLSSTLPASSTSRPSLREDHSSPRRPLPHIPSSSQLPHPAPSRRDSGDGFSHQRGKQIDPPSEPQPEPFNIHTYDPQQLLRLLASLLTQIATTNDSLTRREGGSSIPLQHKSSCSPSEPHPPIWNTLTTASKEALSSTSSLAFHARNIPSISLEAYLVRILKYCPASNEVFLSLLVYFDRMSKLAKEANGRLFVIDSYNIHRLVIAGVTVASKFFSDVFYTNSRYAKVGGLPQAELNQLELQFLLLNDFRLMISMAEMQSYAEQLIRFSQTNADPSLVPPPSLRTSSNGPSPAAPTKYMNYVGAQHDRVASHVSDYVAEPSVVQTPQAGPTRPLRRSGSPVSLVSEATSEAETEFDGSTDDEPTIRPTHSSASSDAASIYSTYTDEGDSSREGFDVEESMRSARRSGGDSHMASP
ncbi:unnamed protein product [Somion occarium]|uniref:Cyclin-domain-containing protein n=1 Tax=Somion occarium TaxID=3059160 RepID=A0ABP1D4W8_9APHY